MKRTAEETAVLVALLQKRAGRKRARISEKTIRVLSKRRFLRVAFLENLSKELDDLGLRLVELQRGGFGLLSISSLSGAPTILAKQYLGEDLSRLREDPAAISDFRAEVEQDVDESE